MKNLMNRLLPVLGVICILIAVFLFFKPKIDDFFKDQENDKKIEEYNDANKSDKNKNGESQKDKAEIPKDKSKMAGYLEIPDAKIKEPVYPGPATPEQLKRGVSFAEEEESLSDQNISIAGHTDYSLKDYQFTNLKGKVKKGSDVSFTVGNDKRKYKITSIRNVPPTEVSVLDEQQNQKDRLTLITCDNFDPNTGEWLDRTIYVAEKVA
ncbi:class A sortase SrtA [Staphylococcus massiliensis]|uniref:Sortase A n=1 Tax=Staphylococcus massiliensis S46 TaxID=1229783 RepID=K9AV78_9STAP|nr:class A sortase SrtA [Staphylococcus massiliensis]EKU50001.1 sortase A [Staphylococcus massiliensis S46]MCG3399244.1 class A sortase SrtA [Staphylococcus massiliensis]MCG3402289.1 class A sortase SrtA [Staphylococcus massiliensis]MCG3411741.1 class A sortase SrtA [Staphylococcus massiliensis]POA00561.1 class A sortase SrtA [Staphylococcus massiliensis CCUG 55927]